MRVCGREAVSVVDDRDVPVAAHDAGEDDPPCSRGANGCSQRRRDVDSFVHAPPPPAEAARHDSADRPDEAARRRSVAGRAPARATARGLNLRRELRTLGGHGLDVFLGLVAVRPDRGEDARTAVPRGRERVLARDESFPGGDLLRGLAGEDLSLVGDLDLRQPRLLARDPELVPEGLDLLRDRLVLAPDRLEVLELVDEVAEALDLEEDPERVGVLALVELDEPLLEPGLCDRELALEVDDPRGLVLDLLLQLLEAASVRVELGLEVVDERGERADVAAESVDPLIRGLDVRGERTLLAFRVVDVLAKAGDPAIEIRLPVGRRLSECRWDRQREKRGKKRCDEADAASVNHRNDFGKNAGLPALPTGGLRTRTAFVVARLPVAVRLRHDQVFDVRDAFRRLVSGAGGCSGSGSGSSGDGSGTG